MVAPYVRSGGGGGEGGEEWAAEEEVEDGWGEEGEGLVPLVL